MVSISWIRSALYKFFPGSNKLLMRYMNICITIKELSGNSLFSQVVPGFSILTFEDLTYAGGTAF